MKRRGENEMGWDGDGTHKMQVEFVVYKIKLSLEVH